MADKLAEQFANTLRQIEESGDAQPLVELFAEDAQLSSPERNTTEHAAEGIRQFWERYLATFQGIRSEFTRVRQADDLAVLEWDSTGTLSTGEPVRYAGVSILDLQGGKVTRFATYYDTAALRVTSLS